MFFLTFFQVVPYVWYMAFATFPAGILGWLLLIFFEIMEMHRFYSVAELQFVVGISTR